jgi:hypothetical protein
MTDGPFGIYQLTGNLLVPADQKAAVSTGPSTRLR